MKNSDLIKRFRAWSQIGGSFPFHQTINLDMGITQEIWEAVLRNDFKNQHAGDFAQAIFHQHMIILGQRFQIKALKYAYENIGQVYPDQDVNTHEYIVTMLMIAIAGHFCMAAEAVGAVCHAFEQARTSNEVKLKVHTFTQAVRNYSPQGDIVSGLYSVLQKPLSDPIADQKVRNILNFGETGKLDGKRLKSAEHFYNKMHEIGKIFLDLYHFYNAYKHGFRLAQFGGSGPLQSFHAFMYPERNPEDSWHFHAFKEDYVKYLCDKAIYCASIHEGLLNAFAEMVESGKVNAGFIINDENEF
jgi:hypothetical protein